MIQIEANNNNNTEGSDYIDVRSKPYLIKILHKQGDRGVIFADKALKFTASGKMKRRILIITDLSIYIVDPDTHALKRRPPLAAVDKLCLSELSDNFFAVIVPTEYDLLIATTRKTQIVKLMVESMKATSNYDLEVHVSNSFEYHAASKIVKEIKFEEMVEMLQIGLQCVAKSPEHQKPLLSIPLESQTEPISPSGLLRFRLLHE